MPSLKDGSVPESNATCTCADRFVYMMTMLAALGRLHFYLV